MAVALAPHVLVNSVSPGLMEGTRMTEKLSPDYRESARRRALIEVEDAVKKEVVADQVLTFARSGSVTGQTLLMDGGTAFH